MKYKVISLILAIAAIGCAQKPKAKELDELTVTKLQRDQAQLQALQAQANPIIADINAIQEKAKKDYPGQQIDLNTMKLISVQGDKK